MCSNYDSVTKTERLKLHFGVTAPPGIKGQVWPLYHAPFIRRHPHHDVGDEAVPPREALAGLFGLIPHWAGEIAFGKRTYNARSETVAEKPSFRDAWRLGQHCIVPVENVYEPDWRSGRAVPTRIQRKDDKPMGIAGLWAVNRKATGEEVLTGGANDGGIDGMATFAVDDLALVSFRIAWQCKKYNADHKVQPAEVREFRGALDHGFQHGVFFTTSRFTVKAEEEARRAGQIPIRLVDISRLIKLLKAKELGVAQVDNDKYIVHHEYFEKFKSKGTTGWGTKTLFSKTGKPAAGMGTQPV